MDHQQRTDRTNHVLEYFNKYSKNPDLSKYFSGTEARLQKIENSIEKEPTEAINIQDPNIDRITTSIGLPGNTEKHEDRVISPSSSVASIKKLEWDNGADIGNMKEESSGNNRDFRNMFHHLTFSSETSSSPIKDVQDDSSSPSPPKENILSSQTSTSKSPALQSYHSSSDIDQLKKINQPLVDEKSDKNKIKKKIGLPVANSTPYEEPSSKNSDDNVYKACYKDTPLLKNNNKPKRNLNLFSEQEDHVKNTEKTAEELNKKKSKMKKEVNLCLTKPVSLECIPVDDENKVDKISQTSFYGNKTSKNIQTEISTDLSTQSNRKEFINPLILSPKVHKIELITHKEDTKINERRSDIEKVMFSSDSSQEREPSQKGFFNYELCESNKLKQKKASNEKSQQSSTDAPTTSGTNSLYSENYDEKKEQKSRTKLKVEESEGLLLAEMITLNHSRDLNTDIKRSIDILQRLLKSKKYDPSTKKYYIKQIVQKIVESKYSEDSTTSSELFRPKHVSRKHETKNVSKEHAIDNITDNKEPSKEHNGIKLMDNVPWYPCFEPQFSRTKKKVKLPEKQKNSSRRLVDTNSESTIDEKSNCSKNFRSSEKRRTNLENIDHILSNVPSIPLENNFQSSDNVKTKSDNKSKSMFTEKIDDNCWKSAKTLSELMLEKRGKDGSKRGQGDYLLSVAKNERLHQLSWINNEIEHLVKLKDMLEKKHKREPVVEENMANIISSLLQMKVNDMQGFSKNLEVFICKCCTNGGECTCQECPCARKKSLKKKKSASLTPGYYTIATQLDPEGNLMDITVFDEEGQQKYNYKNDGLVEDVLIISTENSTEIKLKPRQEERPGSLNTGPYKMCEICKRYFVPPADNPDMCICGRCFDPDQDHLRTSNKKRESKICRICDNPYSSSNANPCVCTSCLRVDAEPDLNKENKNNENWKICDACGKLFQQQSDTDLCLCERCHLKKEKSSRSTSKICKLRDKKNISSTQTLEDDRDEELQPYRRCACQKVSFREPLEFEHCRCGDEYEQQLFPNSQLETYKKSVGKTPHYSNTGSEEVDICPKCGRIPMFCRCGAKFIPKKPLLVGKESYGHLKTSSDEFLGENVLSTCSCRSRRDPEVYEKPDFKRKKLKPEIIEQAERRREERYYRPCSHCAGVQVETLPCSSPSTPKSTPSIPCPVTSKSDFGVQINQNESDEDSNILKNKISSQNDKPRQLPCSHCAGVQVDTVPCSDSSTAKSSSSIPCPTTAENDLGVQMKSSEHLNIPRKKSSMRSCICKNSSTQHEQTPDLPYVRPSVPPYSRETSSPDILKPLSIPEKNPCCEACQQCNRVPSLSDNFNQNSTNIYNTLSNVPLRSTREKITNTLQQCDEDCPSFKIRVLQKRSCQCYSCSHCSVQTRRGDRNARCQCRICENCGIQVTQEEREPLLCSCIKPDSEPRNDNDESRTNESAPTSSSPSDKRDSRDSIASSKKEVEDDRNQNDEDDSEACDDLFSCPSKKKSCPAIVPPCPGAGDKPCPAYPPEACPDQKLPPGALPREDMENIDFCPAFEKCRKKNRSKQEKKKKDSCPGVEKCPRKTSAKLREEATSEQEDGKNEERPEEERVSSSQSRRDSSSSRRKSSLSGNQQNMQLYMCTTGNISQNPNFKEVEKPKNCTCPIDTCKCNQTATHEEKKIQCPAFKQCTSQTEEKENAKVQCRCKADAGTSCECGLVSCECDRESSCSCQKSSSTSNSNSNNSSETMISCVCCKKKNILKDLMRKIPLCDPCQNIHQKCFYPYNYSNPLHTCMCYSLVNRDILCQLKNTLTELERLEIYEQYCEVLKNCKCCEKCGCQCKLPKKFKNGCAYFLKLEDACLHTRCEEEEGDEESGNGEEVKHGGKKDYLPEVIVKVPNCRAPCARNKQRGQSTQDQMRCPSIQTYLCTMKPDFIEKAEKRRQLIQTAVLEREEDVENRKLKFIERIDYVAEKFRNHCPTSETKVYGSYGGQTKAFCVVDIQLDDGPRKVRPRIFNSFKEMRDLTRRKYLHLSEVKNRKNVFKEKRLREANRILANTFTKRLQRSTLRGHVDIPTNVRVISY